MGYTTTFTGPGFWTEPKLKDEHRDFINMFADTRHMCYAADDIVPGPTRSRVETPKIPEAAHVLCDDRVRPGRQAVRRSGRVFDFQDLPTIDYNTPPPGVPGLWCSWSVMEDGNINWNGQEKFYNYVEWLTYLVETYLRPWGYSLNGLIDFEGEDSDDYGRIIVTDNEVTTVFQWRGE